ncbi:MAG: MAPEG family protein [Terricaulis sp.]
MTLELRLLAYSILVFFVVVMIQATAGIIHHGGLVLANNRDNLKPPSVFGARMKRLVDNYRENLWFFAPLVLIAAIVQVNNEWTVLGARLFFYSRIAHALLYATGAPLIRPLFWFAGVIGCGMIFLALFGILS